MKMTFDPRLILMVFFAVALVLSIFFGLNRINYLEAEQERMTKCYQQYRAVDIGIEKCVEENPEEAGSCLAAWQYKGYIISTLGCDSVILNNTVK